MIELILIVFLAVLVVFLITHILIRRHREKGAVLIREEVVNDLISSMAGNIADNKIQDIAGSVSDILARHLGCDKILFLKQYRAHLEVNFFSGIKGFNRNDFRLELTADCRKKLKDIRNVAGLSQLKTIFPEDYVERFEKLGLKYFFPVFLRDNLYGLYLINTALSPDDNSLNLLATTLAFNLSAAYYINTQEQKIKHYENKVKMLSQKSAGPDRELPPDILRLLKMRNCHQLLPEMLKALKNDCNFSRLGFYLKCNSTERPFLSISWNLGNKADKLFRENYDHFVQKIKGDEPVSLNNAPGLDDTLKDNLKNLQGSSSSSMLSLDWTENRKAVLVFGGKKQVKDALDRIQKFHREAIPLVENIARFEKAEELSYTDGLTGIYNFRYFEKRIMEEFQRAKRYHRSLALLIIDLDDLKFVNDQFGHLAGDALIKSYGISLTETVRTNDVVTRYGGDEFCIIMPDTGREETLQFMNRIRAKADNDEFHVDWANKKIKYTVSIGGAVYPSDADSIEDLIHAADMALLEAKSAGRNCFKIFRPEHNRKG